MELHEYLKGKNRGEFAKKVGTSVHYMNQLCVNLRRPSPEMALKIQLASHGQVTILEQLFPAAEIDKQVRRNVSVREA